MSLTKETTVDRIEVLADGRIQIRTAVRIIENGLELTKTYSRQVLSPADTLDGQEDSVVRIAAAAWTEEVIEAYQVECTD